MGLIRLPSLDDILDIKDPEARFEALLNMLGLLMKSLSEINGYITTQNVKVLNAKVIKAGTITADKIGANQITANEIAAGAITADEIQANAVTTDKILAGAVTAAKMTVEQLSAIAADLGTVTAGSITSDTTINIGTDATIGNKLYIDGSNFLAGIEWTGENIEIYIDPATNVLVIYSPGTIELNAAGGVYANGTLLA